MHSNSIKVHTLSSDEDIHADYWLHRFPKKKINNNNNSIPNTAHELLK